jgi:hypothetical protein
MALPKLKVPLFDIVIPSTKANAKFRPFLVKEEKILLIAQTGNTKKEMINALKQVINNCVTTETGDDIDIDALTTFDLEYLFLKIRAKSVDNIVKLKYIDHEDDKNYEFEVPLDDVEIIYHPEHTNKIKVDDDIGIILKYPTSTIVNKLDDTNLSEADVTTMMIKDCLDKIYDADTVYLAKESTQKELDEFIDSLNVSTFEGIKKFFETMPKLYYKIEYTNSKGTERIIELSTLDDFFTLV